MPWEKLLKPEGRNRDDKNQGGIVLYLRHTGSQTQEEIGRVAFDRKNAVDPDVPFAEALRRQIETADEAIGALNGLLEGAGQLR